MNGTISSDVRARVDSHLDAVEKQLNVAGVPREKRRSIADDLETHILEMLGAMGDDPIPMEKVDEMLGRLDPPEAYGKDLQPPPQAPLQALPENIRKPQLCPEARQGIKWIALAAVAQSLVVMALTPVLVVTPAGTPLPANSPRLGVNIFLVMVVVMAVVAPIMETVLGWTAVERIRNSDGRLYGLGLAAFEALFYPLIVVWIGAFTLCYWVAIAYYNGSDIPNRGRALWLIGSMCTAILLSVILAWLLNRSTRAAARTVEKG